MRMPQLKVAAALVAWLAVGSTLAAQDVKVKEEKPGLLAKAKITVAAATAAAQAKVPKGKIASIEIEEEKGKLIYSFDLKTDGKPGTDEVAVDAMSGKAGAVEHEDAAAEKKEADADKAKAKAAVKPASKKP